MSDICCVHSYTWVFAQRSIEPNLTKLRVWPGNVYMCAGNLRRAAPPDEQRAKDPTLCVSERVYRRICSMLAEIPRAEALKKDYRGSRPSLTSRILQPFWQATLLWERKSAPDKQKLLRDQASGHIPECARSVYMRAHRKQRSELCTLEDERCAHCCLC
eukprot:81809-Amphidinium_carterae.1